MRWAISDLDGKEWEAAEFERQDPNRLRQLRTSLRCIGCDSPAFFRVSSAGRRPAFGAFHCPGCVVTTSSWGVFRYLSW